MSEETEQKQTNVEFNRSLGLEPLTDEEAIQEYIKNNELLEGDPAGREGE
jgi:hypothetical protein